MKNLFRRPDKPVYVNATIVPQHGNVHLESFLPLFTGLTTIMDENRPIKVDYLLAPSHLWVE